MGAFPHQRKNIVAYVFRCNLELTRDMVQNKFLEESPVLVHHKVIKTDSRADENLLYLWKFAEFS